MGVDSASAEHPGCNLLQHHVSGQEGVAASACGKAPWAPPADTASKLQNQPSAHPCPCRHTWVRWAGTRLPGPLSRSQTQHCLRPGAPHRRPAGAAARWPARPAAPSGRAQHAPAVQKNKQSKPMHGNQDWLASKQVGAVQLNLSSLACCSPTFLQKVNWGENAFSPPAL